MPRKDSNQYSAYSRTGIKQTIDSLKEEIRELYLADDIPWIIGYSGGKDSTAIVQLTWLSVSEIPAKKRKKTVNVISTDTLVENPIVATWVERSLKVMDENAQGSGMPFKAHRLTPKVENSYWVNLIGKGYPAPRPKFRWCTERMKIQPSNTFIHSVVKNNGEAILLLGTRKRESSVRGAVMKKHEKHRVRDHLSPNASLPGTLVYTPIEDWTNDDVWLFLMQYKNPWGYNNKDLLTMYQGASPDGECPLVVDTSTPSCGDSRFGCWVCTLVDKDKSMSAMIQNDDEKDWMLPLLEFRNKYLEFRPNEQFPERRDDRSRRDFRRMAGHVTIFHERAVHGPYTQDYREELLRELLKVQQTVNTLTPENQEDDYSKDLQLISHSELDEIRRIWIVEKHELEDRLPKIYEEVVGQPYPNGPLDENLIFGSDELEILKDVCKGDRIHFELARDLLDIERRFRTMSKRSGLYREIDRTISRGFYENEEDATKRAIERLNIKERAEQLLN